MPARPVRGTRRLLSALGTAVVLAVTAGCSALGGSDAAPEQGTPDGSGLERSTLQVGVLPIVDVAYLQRAQGAGYFAEEGLTVELVPIQGGAVAVPQLVSGDLDLTFTNYATLFQAQAQGVGDFRIVTPGYDAGASTFLTMALPASDSTAPDSIVRTPQDLGGRRVAVNTFGNIVELTARSALEANGVESDGVTFVAIPFPEMLAALQNRQVDAAVLVEPFITQAATTAGAVGVLDTASGPTEGIPVGGVGATAEFVGQNPRTVAAFQRAVARAQAEMGDRAVVEQTLPTYTQISPATAALLNLGTWPTSLDATRLQRVADLMREFGVLTAPLDVDPMILPPPAS